MSIPMNMNKLNRDIKNGFIVAILAGSLALLFTVIKGDAFLCLDALLYIVCGILMKTHKSRLCGVLICFDITASIVMGIAQHGFAISALIIPLIIAYFMYKGMIATFKLHQNIEKRTDTLVIKCPSCGVLQDKYVGKCLNCGYPLGFYNKHQDEIIDIELEEMV